MRHRLAVLLAALLLAAATVSFAAPVPADDASLAGVPSSIVRAEADVAGQIATAPRIDRPGDGTWVRWSALLLLGTLLGATGVAAARRHGRAAGPWSDTRPTTPLRPHAHGRAPPALA